MHLAIPYCFFLRGFRRRGLWRCRLSAALLTAALTTGASGAIAQNSSNEPVNSTANLVALNMRDADIRALIQWIAEQTHKQIVIDPRVQGRVTAYADKPMTIAQAYQVFLSLLEVYGYSSSEIDGILRIYPSALAKTSPRAVVDDFNRSKTARRLPCARCEKHFISAMAQMIKPLLSTRVTSRHWSRATR